MYQLTVPIIRQRPCFALVAKVVEVDLKTRKLRNRILDQVGGNNIVERMQDLGLQVLNQNEV